jgi:hypothetical protein
MIRNEGTYIIGRVLLQRAAAHSSQASRPLLGRQLQQSRPFSDKSDKADEGNDGNGGLVGSMLKR